MGAAIWNPLQMQNEIFYLFLNIKIQNWFPKSAIKPQVGKQDDYKLKFKTFYTCMK